MQKQSEIEADPHVKESMNYGNDPEDGRTALEFAKAAGYDDIVEILEHAEKEIPYGWYVPSGEGNNAKVYNCWEWGKKPTKGYFSSRPGAAEANGFDPMKYGTGPVKDDDDEEEVVQKLDAPKIAAPTKALPASTPAGPSSLPVALLFPGQGSQCVGMLKQVKDIPAVQDDESCDKGLLLLQRQSRKLSEEVQEKEAEEWGGSCQSYGCRRGYHSWMKCQCNSECEKYGNCCGDFQAKCVGSQGQDQEGQGGQGPDATGSCASYGCGTSYIASNLCQCNDECSNYGNCCSDFGSTCYSKGQDESDESQATPRPSWRPGPAPSPPAHSKYRLVWRAEGESFFSKFNFLWDDPNHGSAQYLIPPYAQREGVVEATRHWAILRAGRRSPQYKYKRMTARIETKASWKNFLSIFKFSHVPYGCGVWPALFTLADHGQWPNGGELDMLEYVNMDVSKASFHTGGSCTLDPSKVNEYGSMPDRTWAGWTDRTGRNKMNYDCVTNYPDRLGCAPNKWMKSAQNWAQSPGVLATQWTEDFIKLFYIPEHEIPQERVQNCRAVDPLKEWLGMARGRYGLGFEGILIGLDCCTEFIWDPDNRYGTDQYLRQRAYFNISYIKGMLSSAKDILGYDVLDLCLQGPEAKLEETRYCQPVMFLAGLAAVEKLKSEKSDHATRFEAAAGLSLGEYTALCAAGAFTFEIGAKHKDATQIPRFAATLSAQAGLSGVTRSTMKCDVLLPRWLLLLAAWPCVAVVLETPVKRKKALPKGLLRDDLQGPLFVHIPKTAGTSIWKALGPNYTDSGRYPEVAFFCMKHNPPKEGAALRQGPHVPDSWAVVRDVCDRLVSEFAWARLQGWYQAYQKDGLHHREEPNCTTFNKWVSLVMKKYEQDSDVEDCHLIPQWCYASKVDKMIPLSKHLESDIHKMDRRLSHVDLHSSNSHSHVAKRMNVSCGCLTPANLHAVQTHFLEDFVHLRSVLGPSKYEPAAAADPATTIERSMCSQFHRKGKQMPK
eukprot:s36_g44.t1